VKERKKGNRMRESISLVIEKEETQLWEGVKFFELWEEEIVFLTLCFFLLFICLIVYTYITVFLYY
jgi:type IV secretory pathway component VirB8